MPNPGRVGWQDISALKSVKKPMGRGGWLLPGHCKKRTFHGDREEITRIGGSVRGLPARHLDDPNLGIILVPVLWDVIEDQAKLPGFSGLDGGRTH